MSMLHKPFWQDLGGRPVTGSKPVTVVMQSGRMTPPRHAEIQQIYSRFSLAKLTSVADFFVFNRVLTDGTRVRLESMQGQDRVFVWASDAPDDQQNSWEFGWAFIPTDEDLDSKGYTRKPTASKDSLLARDFTKYNASDGTKNFTYVDGKTGKRLVSDGRIGGERIWRGPKSKSEILTYDRNYVYYKGIRISTHLDGAEYASELVGAAIAKGEDSYWIVIVTRNSTLGLVAAMRLPKLNGPKILKGKFIECGEAATQSGYPIKTIWNFSPDGLNAVSVGEDNNKTALHKAKLTAIRGLIPFSVSSELEEDKKQPKNLVVNEFKPEEAKRILRWYGWRDFRFNFVRRYYAVYNRFAAGSFGDSYNDANSVEPGDTPPSISKDVDVPEGKLRINLNMFLYTDGDLPQEGVEINPFNRRRFTFLDKYVGERHEDITYLPLEGVEGPGFPWSTYKVKNDYLGAIITYDVSNGSTPSFRQLEDLVKYCENKWSNQVAVKTSSFRVIFYNRLNDITNHVNTDFYPGTKKNYKNLTEAAQYIHDRGHFIYRTAVAVPVSVPITTSAYQSDSCDLTYIDRNIQPITPSEKAGIEDRDDVIYGELHHTVKSEWIDSRGDVRVARHFESIFKPVFDSVPHFKMDGVLTGMPDYTNNYKTRWLFKSELAIEGRNILAAGYDKNGELSIIHIEADSNQKITYTAEIIANDEVTPKRKCSFSGGYTCKLKINDTVIDDLYFSVNDSFEAILDRQEIDGFGDYLPSSGSAPSIKDSNIHVWDVDEYLGHVLYRKFETSVTTGGDALKERDTKYDYSYVDCLYTPSAKHTLGDAHKFSGVARKMSPSIAKYRSTEEAMWAFSAELNLPNHNGMYDFYDSHEYQSLFAEAIPEDQKNPRENYYGWDDSNYSTLWVRYGAFIFPRNDQRIYKRLSYFPHQFSVNDSGLMEFGYFDTAPRSRLVLRSFSDDSWMVCFNQEKAISEANLNKSTAKYFIKTGKKSKVVEVDAGSVFPFLVGNYKKLMRLNFYIGLKK